MTSGITTPRAQSGPLTDVHTDVRIVFTSREQGGVATPADAALMMQMGMDGVFVGSGIFKSGDAAKRARAIVQVPPLPLQG